MVPNARKGAVSNTPKVGYNYIEVNERRKKFKQGLEIFKERLRKIVKAVDEGTT